MNQEQLRERIQKTEDKIAKIEKRIKKWQDAQTREAFLKADQWLIDLGRDENYLWGEYLNNCARELRYANHDLDDAKVLLDKYNNLLALEEAKDDEFNNRRIKVIWDFLLHYKEMVAQYIRGNIEILNEYYSVDSELCEWHNSRGIVMREQGITEDEWKAKCRELRERKDKLKSYIHPITYDVAKYNGYKVPRTVDEGKLDEILIKDCKERYLKLIDEVTKYTGKITDVAGLNMNCGELGGLIIGEKGKAKVQTFSAGGWNIQCYHYRHKVTKVG